MSIYLKIDFVESTIIIPTYKISDKQLPSSKLTLRMIFY